MKNSAKQQTILVTGNAFPSQHREHLERLGYGVVVERIGLTEDEVIDALTNVSACILGGSARASRRVIESAEDLKIIAFFGVGYQSFIDVKAATENGVAVTNAPGGNAQSVAEFTMSLMLDAVKRTTFLIESTKRGDWKQYKTWNLHGKTLGIVGMGTIGSRVAAIAKNGFGMNILYTSRTRKPAVEADLDAIFVGLHTLLEKSDVVSIHAACNEETAGMIGTDQFQCMKPEAVLVNCSRPELVDPKALYAAISNHKVSCVAFDSYYVEPAPTAQNDEYGLLQFSNELFLVSPHTAYLTDDSMQSTADMSVASLLDMLEGRPVRHVVNPEYVQNIRSPESSAHSG